MGDSLLIPPDFSGYHRGTSGQAWKALAGAAATGASSWMRLRSGRMVGSRFRRRQNVYRAQRGARQARFSLRRRGANRATTGRGVTFEHDRQFIYRKKRQPRFKRRRWKRFSRKVHAVAEKELGSRTVVFNKSVAFSNATSGEQLLGYVGLYGQTSTNSHLNDLNNISGYENAAAPTAAAGDMLQETTKYLFQSGILDITMRNVSHVTNDSSALVDATLETDIYEIFIGTKGSDATSGQAYQSPIDFFDRGATITHNIGGAGTQVRLWDRGCTPWDLPAALSRSKIKIMKKTKFFIRSGATITYQVRDPKRRVSNQEDLAQFAYCNRPGWTRHVLIIAKAVPGITIGAGTLTTEKLQIGVTRKYLYKIEGFNANRDRYLTGV